MLCKYLLRTPFLKHIYVSSKGYFKIISVEYSFEVRKTCPNVKKEKSIFANVISIMRRICTDLIT
nr:MAG TPA: hypothetical protein [Caudoviricetes sp.]